MNLGLENKAFVIGGGSKGLGRAIAGVLVDEGARVLLLSRSQDELDRAVGELGPNAAAVAIDIADPKAPETIAQRVDSEFGRLDGILVNAGGPPGGAVLDLTDEQWLNSYQMLIGGPIRLLRTLVPKITSEGSILFITSSSVRQPIPNLDSSNVLRPGVAALAKTLARQLGPRIRVNSIAPGRFDTDRVRSLDAARAETLGTSVEQQRDEASKAIPLGRYGDPAEFGRMAAFLLSPAGSYVSGISAQVDGAMVTAIP